MRAGTLPTGQHGAGVVVRMMAKPGASVGGVAVALPADS